MMNIEQLKKLRERIKEIDLIVEPLLAERELLRKLDIYKRNEFSNLDFIHHKFSEFIENQKDILKEYIEIINKNFWELI